MDKKPKINKRLTAEQISQIEIDTNTDDRTVGEMLAEDSNPAYKFPYSSKFVKKHILRKTTNDRANKNCS